MACRFNPCLPAARKPVSEITDRAKRYRANACPPPGPRQCGLCGGRRNVEVEHIDGDESNGAPANLMWACRACNTRKGIVFRNAGAGVRTRQYNPAAEGARSLGQWLTAVMVLKGNSDAMSLPAAIATVRATPASRRSQFAAEIWRRRKARQGEAPF